MKYKCKTCDGTYESICNDGLRYFHACPLVVDKDGVCIEMENKRDENIKSKLEGLGQEII